MEEQDAMSYFEAAIVSMFGVILPTGDVGSDYWLAGPLFLKDYSSCMTGYSYLDYWLEQRYKYGGITLTFPLLSFVFTTHHWWQMENPKKEGGSGRIKTLPLLLSQVWPQYRMIRILYLGLVKKSPQWRREQKVMLENVSGLEPFIESGPQCFWIAYLGFLTNGCVAWKAGRHGGWGERDYSGSSMDWHLGLGVFVTSVLSASYGMTKS